ncbi:uncharacterized protein [Pseudorasbora parva]|uniref:uncharacterized protein isoform X2 n=1 Tax=Pseudorasbora parva TaxID=51549 RepID=UPI00351F3B8D
MMDVTSDLFWPGMLFSLLAIVVAAIVVLGRNKGPVQSKCTHQTSAVVEGEERAGPEPGAFSQYHEKQYNETRQQLQKSAKSLKANETLKHLKDSNLYNAEEVCKSDSPVHSTIGWGEDTSESGIRNALRDYAQSPDTGNKPLKYMAGMLRTCQLEKMMTKEELEEEQRIQQEQLAAIFQLLRDKEDTFGEVTESDLQEQLKLYSI